MTLRLAFMGTPDFAVPSLDALIAAGHDIAAVYAQPARPKGRGHKAQDSPVAAAATRHGIPVRTPERLDPEEIAAFAALKLDAAIVVAYGLILPKPILDAPRLGCVNVHASLLPKYRGAAPISWAIIGGEEKTGVTTMLMDEGLDTGPVLLTREIAIGGEDTAGSLGMALSELGASLLVETIRAVRAGSVAPASQSGEATFAPPLKKEDGLIDWKRSADEIFNFVRGMDPWPVAHCRLGNETLRILRTGPLAGEGRPGIIEKADGRQLVVGTGGGLLSIIELQPPGKRPMSAASFLQGRRLMRGQALQ